MYNNIKRAIDAGRTTKHCWSCYRNIPTMFILKDIKDINNKDIYVYCEACYSKSVHSELMNLRPNNYKFITKEEVDLKISNIIMLE